MNITKLQTPLTADQIEFRVQSVVSEWKWAIVLAYKNARVDMERLDEAVWPLNWKREHTRDNKNCIVSIRDSEKSQWVSKEDTGTESNQDKEKWLASDSFKRACFNRGIGRELYDFPFIYINTVAGETEQYQGKRKATKKFMKDWKWTVDHTDWIKVTARDKTGKVRFWDGAVDVPEEPKKENNLQKIREFVSKSLDLKNVEPEQAKKQAEEFIAEKIGAYFTFDWLTEDIAKDIYFKLLNDKTNS